MLIGFNVKNYKSFKELQHFSMLAGKSRNNENHIVEKKGKKILKFSGFYGANGSGKSNFIEAVGIVGKILNNGVDSLFNNLYYRGNKDLKEENSYFEYEIALNDKFYSYGFEINIFNREITSEWLIDMTSKNEKILFERDLINGNFITKLKRNNYFINCLEEMKKNNKELFLNEMVRRIVLSNNNSEFFDDIMSVYKFLNFDMVVIYPKTHKLFEMDYFKNKKKILEIFKLLDININDINEEEYDFENIRNKISVTDYLEIIKQVKILSMRNAKFTFTLRIGNDLYALRNAKNIRGFNCYILRFNHYLSSSTFGPYEESDGTIRILELIDILLSKNKVFLIDEVDSSLHPVLVSGLLKIFLKENINNQLIITTHEVKTLDFDLVRKDEIWFAEKSKNGDTRLYSLEEYKDVRFDKKIDKAYMEGRFGAIAQIDI